ncbi:MAG TPA: FxLYD domain-containing protein [Coriobacteriia bacterium]|jgi:uncharacterized membrane protein
MRRIILLSVVVVALVGLVGYVLLVPNATEVFAKKTTVTDPTTIAKLTLGFVQNPYPDDYNVMRIPGWIDNRGNQRIVTADVEIQLLDQGGNRKELVKYQVTDIAPRSRKSFDANGGNFNAPRTAKVKIVKLEVAQ